MVVIQLKQLWVFVPGALGLCLSFQALQGEPGYPPPAQLPIYGGQEVAGVLSWMLSGVFL